MPSTPCVALCRHGAHCQEPARTFLSTNAPAVESWHSPRGARVGGADSACSGREGSAASEGPRMLRPAQEAKGTSKPLESWPLWGLKPTRGGMTSARRSRLEHMTGMGDQDSGGQRQRLHVCFQSPRETRSQSRREPGGQTQELRPAPGQASPRKPEQRALRGSWPSERHRHHLS